jgi:competence protein ComEC
LGAVVLGILAADNINLSSGWFLIFAIVLLLAGLRMFSVSKSVPAGMLLLIALASVAAFNFGFRFKTFPPGHIANYADGEQWYTVFGTVTDWPDIREHQTYLIIRVDSLCAEGERRRTQGRMILKIQTETTAVGYGDRVVFDSRLYHIRGGESLSGFNYRRYMNLKGIFAVAYLPHQYNIAVNPVGRGSFYRLVDQVRDYIKNTLRQCLSREAAGLATGFLIGETRGIAPEVYDRFRDTGTLHLLAVSGSNVALVIIVFALLFRASAMKATVRTGLLLLLILVFSYLAYNQPSVVRAAIMAALVLIAGFLQRRREYNNIIAATAAIILLYNPTQLYDVGFQLSFAVAWGLILFTPPAVRRLKLQLRHPVWRYPIFLFAASLIAQLISLPLIAFYFQRVPLVSVLSNMVIIPLVSVTVIGEVILLLAALVWLPLGQFLGSFLDRLIDLTLYFLRLFASPDINPIWEFSSSWESVLLYFVILTVVITAVFVKAFRVRGLIILLIVINLGLARLLFPPEVTPVFAIAPQSSGLVIVNHWGPGQLIMTDLTHRDYPVGRVIIGPYLKVSRIPRPLVVALSNDYKTVRETVGIHLRSAAPEVFYPAETRRMVLDILAQEDHAELYSSARFYSGYKSDSAPAEYQGRLQPGLMVYHLDSTWIVLMSNRRTFSDLKRTAIPGAGYLVVVKPRMTGEDISFLSEQAGERVVLAVCNRLSGEARELYREGVNRAGRPCELIIASEVGVVKLVKSGAGLRVQN